jgi:F-type H+-transporting ATPase subunit b
VTTLNSTKKFFAASIVALLLATASAVAIAQEPATRTTSASGTQTTPAANSEAASQGEKDETEAYRHSPMVQKIGAMLGMKTETAATAFELLNFGILAVAIGYFLLKTLPKTFRDRTAGIQKELIEAKTATEEAGLRLSGVEARLAKLDGQILEMKVQAEKDAAAEETRQRAALEDEKKRILVAAEQEIASASLMAQRGLQKYAAELAIEQAARKLVVTAETDRLLVQGFARRLAGEDTTGGTN